MAAMAPEASSPSPQARKLGIKEGSILGFERLPPGWRLSDPPGGVEIVADPSPADVIVAFFSSAEDLAPALPGLGRRIYPAGMLWVAWPRRTAGHTSDITDEVVREAALPLGLVDTKVAAIDDDWSGLRFVWRKERRSGATAPVRPRRSVT
jgi:hypothetical protein